MAADAHGGGKRPPAVRFVVGDRDRAKARFLRRDREWDAKGIADVPLPAPLARRALVACGYAPGAHGGWVGPDGERHGDTEEAARLEFTAAALAAAEGSRDPMEEALSQIREVAMIPVGQILLSPEERIRALTAKVERMGDIAAAGGPDEDWRPALIEEAGSR
jgi:hypothetical protein